MDIKELAESSMIASLREQLLKLEEENASLKSLLKKDNNGMSNEMLICQVQIHRLKEQALVRDLNADETRRLATYVDIIEKTKGSVLNPEEQAAKNSSVEDLIDLIN
jgi:hypothetical protein